MLDLASVLALLKTPVLRRTCRAIPKNPFKAEITGSNPVRATKNL